MKEEEYIKRLEKIVDKQDNLLTQLDAKFKQQDSLNENLSNQNKILREDIKKHKNLLMDMNKTVNQQKNVVNKLKKELEDQLKIQQDLHKDYGQVIKELTDELENEKNNVKSESKENKDKNDKVDLPPREHDVDYVSEATNFVSDIKEKSSVTLKNLSNESTNESKVQICENCGAEVSESHHFCESCGYKIS